MNELKPEDVMKAFDWQVSVANHIGSATISKDEINAIAALLREKDERIKELEESQGAEFICFVGEPHKVDRCPYGDELARLQKEVAEKDAEIERLKQEHKDYIEDVTALLSEKNAECEKLMREKTSLECIIASARHRGRAEAITEFEEKVCREVEQTPNANEFFINAWKAKFAEIAKETKGENNASDTESKN